MNRKKRRAKEQRAKMLATGPRTTGPRATMDVAMEHHRAGRLAQAERIYRRILEIHPKNAHALYLLGSIVHQTGKYDAAIDLFGKAIESDPKQAVFYINLGSALLQHGQLDEAIASFRSALGIEPDSAETHSNLGIALREQGRLDQAIVCFRRAVSINPNFAVAHDNLGNALREKGKLDEAISCHRGALEIDPDWVPAHCNHATLHKHVPGDPNIDKLEQLLARHHRPEEERNQLLFALGKAYDDIGRYAEAFSYYRQGNEERARRVDFNAADHRRQIREIERAFSERPRSVGDDSKHMGQVPIFVVGHSKSGKTLVESLLSHHQDVHAAGETRGWSEAIGNVLEKYSIADTYPTFMAVLDEEKIDEIGRIYLEYVSRLAPGCRFFVNTTPLNVQFVGLILQAISSARVIYCRRDPLDNCLFAYLTRYKTQYYSYDFKNLASHYADYYDIMAYWQSLYGDRILTIGYEKLVRDPTETGALIYHYCGLEYDPAVVGATLTTDEIGHWRHYEPYLGPLRQALGDLAR